MTYKCSCCDNTITPSKTIISCEDEGVYFFCEKCNSLFGTCAMCEHGAHCGFFNESDADMPQFITIQRTQRQGNATFIQQMQTPNPDRVRKYCVDGKCICCNEEDEKRPYCCRFTQYTTCTNYQQKKFPKFIEDFSQPEANEN